MYASVAIPPEATGPAPLRRTNGLAEAEEEEEDDDDDDGDDDDNDDDGETRVRTLPYHTRVNWKGASWYLLVITRFGNNSLSNGSHPLCQTPKWDCPQATPAQATKFEL